MLRHCFALAVASVLVTPAFAHITVRPDTGEADRYFQTAFTVPHGCGDGAATIAIREQIPDGIYTVKPQFKPGWIVTTRTRKIDPPLKAPHGPDIIETIDSVEWRGGPLPDTLFDSFGLIVKLPADAGQTLYFPVTQECDKGRVEWSDIPAAGDAHHQDAATHPAPSVTVTPGAQK